MNLTEKILKLTIVIVSFSEKQIYIYTFLNKRVKKFSKPKNYEQKYREKVFQGVKSFSVKKKEKKYINSNRRDILEVILQVMYW